MTENTIDFAITGTIGLTSGELLVNKVLTISGPGAENLAVNGKAKSTVFHIAPGETVTISGLTIELVDPVKSETLHFHPHDTMLDAEKWGSMERDKPEYSTVAGFAQWMMDLYYSFLNCGFRLAISAGTDAFTNVADHYTPGGGRVYVHAGQPLDYNQWIGNYKRGRSFASNGPSILYTLDDREPGDEIRVASGAARKFRLRALVETQIPLDRVEVIVNGKPLVSRSAGGQKRISLDEPIALERSSWVAVRAMGPWHRLVLNDDGAFAHSSPIYVYFGDQPIAFRGDVRFYIDWIERLIARVKERGRFATSERRAEVVALFERALGKYRQIEATATP
jgi:hypothetical protein